MKRYFISMIAFFCILSSMNAQVNTPLIQVPSIQAAPVADGKISEQAWQNAARLTEFVNWTLNGYIKDRVTIYMYFDAKNLYVAFRNEDPIADSLRSLTLEPRDAFLWGRDHASVRISYNGGNIQMLADPKGTMTDYKNSEIDWNGNWKYGSAINKTEWTCEYSIPFSDIGITDPAAAGDLRVSVGRYYPKGESSSWGGTIRLSRGMNISAETGKWPDPVPGANNISFTARNSGKEPADIECVLEITPLNDEPEFINQQGQGASTDFQLHVSSAPLVYRFPFQVPAGGSINKELKYNLPVEGSYYASASINTKKGTLVKRNVDFWFKIEPSGKKLKDIEKMAGESMAALTRVRTGASEQLRNEANKLYEDIQGLKKQTGQAWKSGKWDDFSKSVNSKQQEAARLLHRVRWSSLNNWNRENDFGIALTHSAIKLRRDALYPLEIKDRINISVAGNEYESFQLAVLPFGKDLKNLDVQFSDLKSPSGNSLPGNKIEISLVDYNFIDWQPAYVTEYKGWHPDPLIPFKSGVTLSGTDLCRPLWITVYAPAGTPAGEYTGTITVKAEGMKPVTGLLSCRVRGFDLPLESTLKTHTWDETEFFADFYNVEEFPVDWYLNFCDVLLKNRLNPGFAGVAYNNEKPENGKYDFSKTEKILDHCLKRGMTRFSILQMKKGQYEKAEEEQVYNFAEAYAKFLKSKGWLDKALVELWDEPTDLEWPYIKERAERLKKIEPGLRLQLFAEGGPYDFFDSSTDKYGLNDLVDIWAPVNIIESPESQAKGKEIWTYFCTLARESAPNFFIDCPAIYQRSIAWYCWMFGVDGFEHWSTNYFWRNVHKGQPMSQKWPNVPWDSRSFLTFNGEGHLVYPGPEGNIYSSVRLENFREGMEEYEYLVKLKDLLDKYGDNPDPQIEEYRQLLKPENYLLHKYPRKVKVSLENTLRFPDRPEMFPELKEEIGNAIEKLMEKGPDVSASRWTIGIYSGPSIFQLNSPAGLTNPVLTASDVTDMKADIVAHPFIMRADSLYYMFFTAKDGRTDMGGIGLAQSRDGLKWDYRQIVLKEDHVLAYPFVFKWKDDYFMIPEAHTQSTLKLYKAARFPFEWKYESDLLSGDHFISSSIVRYKGMWWLYTVKSGNETLRLFYADDLKGPWTEHPMSPVVEKNADIARTAGRPMVINGKLYRLGQDCLPTYGNQVHAFEVTEISTTAYAEKMVEKPIVQASGKGWNSDAMHHIDALQNGKRSWIAVVDSQGKTDSR